MSQNLPPDRSASDWLSTALDWAGAGLPRRGYLALTRGLRQDLAELERRLGAEHPLVAQARDRCARVVDRYCHTFVDPEDGAFRPVEGRLHPMAGGASFRTVSPGPGGTIASGLEPPGWRGAWDLPAGESLL